MQEINPVIVVGMNRTGTKWVSNLLCSFDGIVGAQSERSRGIFETNMFGILQSKFDLTYPEEYVALLELWSMTEQFQHVQGDKKKFYALSPRPTSTLEMFEMLMQDFARRNNARYWLQKTSPRESAAALGYFRNAKVVVTRRGLLDTLKSTWASQLRFRPRKVFRSAFVYVRQEKLLKQILRSSDAIEVRFADMVADSHGEARRLADFLGLDAPADDIVIPFKKNTSFKDNSERQQVMAAWERWLVTILAGILRMIPLRLILASSWLRAKLVGSRPGFLVPGSLGPLADKLADRSRSR